MSPKLLVVGLLVFLSGIAVLAIGAAGQGSSSAGGVVFIGPFPIAFGYGPSGSGLALISVVIGGVMIGLLLLWVWLFGRARGDRQP